MESLNSKREAIIEVKDLRMYFPYSERFFSYKPSLLKAVDGITFVINKGETLGLLGENGCGKTTTARCILRLYKPTRGQVLFYGTDLSTLNNEEMKSIRREMQIIFENSHNLLNPHLKVGEIIAEPIRIHKIAENAEECEARVFDLLALAQLDQQTAHLYPSELDAEKRMRVEIVRAMALQPSFVVCDNPASHPEASVRHQIIDLLKFFKDWRKLTYLYTAEDPDNIRRICDRVMVMQAGKLVEIAATEELFQNPLHPYTRMLMSSAVQTSNKNVKRSIPPRGCLYHPRCDSALPICQKSEPELRNVGSGHMVACHRV